MLRSSPVLAATSFATRGSRGATRPLRPALFVQHRGTWRYFGGVVLVLLLGLIGCEPTNQGYQPVQPIAYSHAVHAGGQQIPCTYCHFGAERGRFAGIPPATLCMNCHTQVQRDNPEIQKIATALDQRDPIEWLRVHKLPDHAYFNHSAHVVTAGLQCQTCHGPVQAMGLVRQQAPLTMGWCLDCHRKRQPARADDPPGVASAPRLTDCSVCHR